MKVIDSIPFALFHMLSLMSFIYIMFFETTLDEIILIIMPIILIFCFKTTQSIKISKLLNFKGITYLGSLTYEMFLIHPLIIMFFKLIQIQVNTFFLVLLYLIIVIVTSSTYRLIYNKFVII